MTVSDFIINDIHLQPLSQKVGMVKELFDELTCSHIPVGEKQVYEGCLSENDVRCFDSDKTLADYRYAVTPFFTRKDHPLLDILKGFAENDTNILPVLTEQDNRYLGYLELNDIIKLLNTSPFFGEDGNTIVVEKDQSSYAFSEIAQIVESNNSKILGIYLNYFSDDTVQITVRTNPVNLNEILQTFRRYGYTVISKHQEDAFLQNLEERSAYLNKYLNI